MLTAIFESTEEGRFYATIRELPEVQTEGDTLQEAEENLTDALCLVLIDKLQELEQKLQAWLGLELNREKRDKARLIHERKAHFEVVYRV